MKKIIAGLFIATLLSFIPSAASAADEDIFATPNTVTCITKNYAGIKNAEVCMKNSRGIDAGYTQTFTMRTPLLINGTINEAIACLSDDTCPKTVTYVTNEAGFIDYLSLWVAKAPPGVDIPLNCGFLDWGCGIQEFLVNATSAMAINTFSLAVANSSRGTNTTVWEAGYEQLNYWVTPALFVTIAVGIIGISMALFRRSSTTEVIQIFIRTMGTYPLILFSVWFTTVIIDWVDKVSIHIAFGNDGLSLSTKLATVVESEQWIGNNAIWFSLIMGLMAVGGLLMCAVFAFRELALVLLVSIAPISFSLFPMREIGKRWIETWLSTVVTLIISKPLMLGLMKLLTDALFNMKTIFSFDGFVIAIGAFAVAFVPLVVFSLFSVVIGGAASAIEGAGSRIGGAAIGVGNKGKSKASNTFSSFISKTRNLGGSSSRPSTKTTGPVNANTNTSSSRSLLNPSSPKQAAAPIQSANQSQPAATKSHSSKRWK